MADTPKHYPVDKYKYRKMVTLTKKQGEQLEALLKEMELQNVSQLVKKILKEKEGD